jgi:dipeptidyl aminopeptidase/acylaminoacyl peptidase
MQFTLLANILACLVALVLFILPVEANADSRGKLDGEQGAEQTAIQPKLVSSIAEFSQRHMQMPTIALDRLEAIKGFSVSDVTLSPDGKWLAFISKDKRSGKNANERIPSLVLMNIQTGAKTTAFTSPKIKQFFWSQDANHIFILSPKFVSLVSLIPEGDETSSASINSSRARIIHKLDSKHDEYVMGIHKQAPHALLVASRHPKSKTFTVSMLDRSGTKHAIYKSRHALIGVMSDKNEPLKAEFIKRVNGGKVELVDVRKPEKAVIAHCDLRDPCTMLGLEESQSMQPQPQGLVVFGRLGQDLIGLYRINVDSDTYPFSRLHQDPSEFFDAYDVSLKLGLPNTISYQTKSMHHYGLNAAATDALTEIEALLKQENLKHPFALVDSFFSIQTNADATLWLLRQESPQNPSVRYFLYDATRASSHDRIKALDSISYQSKRVASYKSTLDYVVSDGMRQFAHITVPNGFDLQTLPLIVMPHGGPWSRTDNHYSFISDFLASRGFVVYEPNFRSSTGMGFQYMVSANKDFGDGIVQQDIIDGMNALLNAGIGDPKRLAIVGHSFGGFSALSGLSFTPELFKMAFAGAPPTDLTYSIEFLDRKDFRNLSDRRQQMFSKLAVDISDEKDKQRLSAQSPFMHWEKVNKSLYVWAGARDDRVDIKKVKQYVAKLRSANTPKQARFLFVDPYAGHSPNRQLSMEAYLYLLEWSLNKHFESYLDSHLSSALEGFLETYEQ